MMGLSNIEYQRQQNLAAGVLGTIVFTLVQVWAGRVMVVAFILAIAGAALAGVECARRVKLRRRNGVCGPLTLHAMLARARADLGNNLLVVGPLVGAAVTGLGALQAGPRGAMTGAVGGILFVFCMALAERYPEAPLRLPPN